MSIADAVRPTRAEEVSHLGSRWDPGTKALEDLERRSRTIGAKRVEDAVVLEGGNRSADDLRQPFAAERPTQLGGESAGPVDVCQTLGRDALCEPGVDRLA